MQDDAGGWMRGEDSAAPATTHRPGTPASEECPRASQAGWRFWRFAPPHRDALFRATKEPYGAVTEDDCIRVVWNVGGFGGGGVF